MIRSHVIDIGGTFVGAAITHASGFRFRAANIAVEDLDESTWPSLDELRAAVAHLFTTGRLSDGRASLASGAPVTVVGPRQRNLASGRDTAGPG